MPREGIRAGAGVNQVPREGIRAGAGEGIDFVEFHFARERGYFLINVSKNVLKKNTPTNRGLEYIM